jgi:DNA-binding XRE family transcriptional regulator
MDRAEFKNFRKKLNKTQRQMAQLLGASIKAVHSYEQGWRAIPIHVERQMFFMVTHIRGDKKKRKPCWIIKKCLPVNKLRCPAWEFRLGNLCWFINGTICDGIVHKDWTEKMKICRACDVLMPMLPFQSPV